MISARQALERLQEGNRRFASGDRMGDASTGETRRRELAAAQEPFAVILGCSDSRVPAEIIFDMVYTPAKTRLLSEAEAQGKTIVSGTVMFLAQAQRQFEIWTGRSDASHLYTAEKLVS